MISGSMVHVMTQKFLDGFFHTLVVRAYINLSTVLTPRKKVGEEKENNQKL